MHLSGRTQTLAQRRMARLLSAVPLFSQCTDHELTAISVFCVLRHVASDEQVFTEGDMPDAFYLVVEGLVSLTKRAAGEKNKVIEILESGQTFAEAVVISQKPYPVTAAALMDSQLVRIDAEQFRRFLLSHPGVSLGMLSALSMRLHQLVNQITSLSLMNAEQRVAEYLLQNASAAGDTLTCNLPNPRRILASRLNLTPETLCRVLTLFRHREWIELESANKVLLSRRAALAALLDNASAAPKTA